MKDNKEKIGKALYLNALMENFVFASLIKSYTKVLHDDQNSVKIDLSYCKILNLIECLNKKDGMNNFYTVDDEEVVNIGNNVSTLDDVECQNLYNLYEEFKKNYIEINDPCVKKKTHSHKKNQLISKITKIGGGVIKNAKKIVKLPILNNAFSHSSKQKIKIDQISRILFSPVDPTNNSTHVCICISGVLKSNEYSSSFLYNNTFKYIINNKIKDSVDYYIYNWQSKKNLYDNSKNKSTNLNEELLYNISMAEIYGRFLAYIISSREVFKFHTISLLGIGLGCNVIKACLMEMNYINGLVDVSDIIQNIIMIGGSIEINENDISLLQLISGSFVNNYSPDDKKLNKYFNNVIGLKEVKIDLGGLEVKNNYLPVIINNNLNELSINSERYTVELNKILNKINMN